MAEDSVKGRCRSILYGLTVLDGGIDPQMLGSTPNCKTQDDINPQSDAWFISQAKWAGNSAG